ncbi:MAG: hypothetical protein CRN43_12470, partial [Candidatus Nephrothrix sp. EaCA]
NLTKEYEAMPLGGQLTIAVSHLLNGKPTIIFGNTTGGLRLLGLADASKREEPPLEFFVYPNQTAPDGVLKMRSNVNGTARFYSVLGQKIGEEFILTGNETITVEPNFSQGIYFVKFFSGKRSTTVRIAVK